MKAKTVLNFLQKLTKEELELDLKIWVYNSGPGDSFLLTTKEIKKLTTEKKLEFFGLTEEGSMILFTVKESVE